MNKQENMSFEETKNYVVSEVKKLWVTFIFISYLKGLVDYSHLLHTSNLCQFLLFRVIIKNNMAHFNIFVLLFIFKMNSIMGNLNIRYRSRAQFYFKKSLKMSLPLMESDSALEVQKCESISSSIDTQKIYRKKSLT